MTLPINDTFNRPDSSIINVTWTDTTDTGDHLTINNNKMRAQWVNSGTQGERGIYQTATPQNQITSTVIFRLVALPTVDAYWASFIRSGADGSTATGWGGFIQSAPSIPSLGTLRFDWWFLDNGAAVGSNPYSLISAGNVLLNTDYTLEQKWLANNTQEVRIWLTSGSRPALPTVSLVRPTPNANGTNYKMVFAHGSNSGSSNVEWLFSQVNVVDDSVPVGTNNSLFFAGGV